MSTTKIGTTENVFGQSLRKARKALGLTQAEFATPLSISGSYVSDIEKGKAFPSEAVIREFSEYYRINRNWLTAGEGEMFTPLAFGDEDVEYLQTLSEDERKVVELMKENPDLAKDIRLAAMEAILKARTGKK